MENFQSYHQKFVKWNETCPAQAAIAKPRLFGKNVRKVPETFAVPTNETAKIMQQFGTDAHIGT